jgi:hypothetical protein
MMRQSCGILVTSALNNSNPELTRLKLAVSIFFTIWQLIDDKTL